jgi:hypothetical protein
MAANTSARFTLRGNLGECPRLTTANVTRDLSVTTNGALLFQAGADGSRIDSIDFNHEAAVQTQASVAAVGRIFRCTSALGANPKLIKEVALPLVAPSATAIGGTVTVTWPNGLDLEAGEFLWVTISATQTSGGYDVICNGGDF